MTPRPATAADIPELARLHVQAWAETYTGLLSEAEIAARDLPARLRQWTEVMAAAETRVMILPGIGFAQSGRQTAARWQPDWPDQVLAIYTLASAHGSGAGVALFNAARTARPFTVEVLTANARARAFYAKMGGVVIGASSACGGHASAPSTFYGFAA
jgi:GNAT superfamily N-acetyltransferase